MVKKETMRVYIYTCVCELVHVYIHLYIYISLYYIAFHGHVTFHICITFQVCVYPYHITLCANTSLDTLTMYTFFVR